MKVSLSVIGIGLVLSLAACGFQPGVSSPTYEPGDTRIDTQALAWQQLGGALDVSGAQSALEPAVAVDTAGNPVAAWYEYDGSSFNVYVKRWSAGAWNLLGSALDVTANRDADRPSLAVGRDGNPVAAWREVNNIYVKWFDGRTWNPVGTGPVNFNPTTALGVSLVLDKTDNPIVVWTEGDKISYNLYVKRWDGSRWVMLGSGPLDIRLGGNVLYKDVAVDAAGNPVVVWTEDTDLYVKRWNGSSWVSLGAALDARLEDQAEAPSLSIDTAGNPVVAWHEYSNGRGRNVYVKRWDGRTWTFVGANPVATGSGTTPTLALDAENHPVMAWSQYADGGYHIYAQRFGGSRWETVGRTPLDSSSNRDAGVPSLALDVYGNPTVVWQEYRKGGYNADVYAKRLVTNGWQPLGDALDTNPSDDAYNSSVARKSSNRPVVTWQERGNIYVKEWSGSSWQRLGGRLNSHAGQLPVIAVRSDDRPVVAWTEDEVNLFIKVWNGSSWQRLGKIADLGIRSYALAIGSNRNPIIAYSTLANGNEATNLYVRRWNGSGWVGLDGKSTVRPLDLDRRRDAGVPALAVDNRGNPAVAWAEFDAVSQSIYVKRWTGTAWTQLGANLETYPANNPALAVDSSGKAVVAWEERVFDSGNRNTNIYVARWSGSSWRPYGSGQPVDKFSGNNAFRPALRLRRDNTPVLAITQQVLNDGVNSATIYLRRWDAGRSMWADLGVPVDNTITHSAQRPSLVLRGDDKPIVAWDEFDGDSSNVYVRQY